MYNVGQLLMNFLQCQEGSHESENWADGKNEINENIGNYDSETEEEQHSVNSNTTSNDNAIKEEIIYFLKGKQHLGGYRNIFTGTEYHHAKVQTDIPAWKYNHERYTRDAQTAPEKTTFQQTDHDAWTQVQVTGIYLPTDNDRILEATDNYVRPEDIQKKRLDAVLVIQRYWRRWLMHRKKLRFLLKILWERREEWLIKREEIDWLNKLQQKRVNPQTKDDFMLMFSDLKKWWMNKEQDIASRKSGAERKAEMCMVLDEEVQCIEGIESLRQRAHKLFTLGERKKFLSKTAEPRSWKAYKGHVLVETFGTQRGRSLHELYITLSMSRLTTKERVDALLTVKETIKPYDFPLTRNLASLANREIDLLLRGMKPKMLNGLRSRIRNLFWEFARQPAFNPEAQRLSKMQLADGKKPKITTCSACNQYYIQNPDNPDNSANCGVLQQRFKKCYNCEYLENEGWSRKDLEIYKRMLKLLKESEEKKRKMGSILYMLQPSDICYMVEKIWQSQSAVSGVSILKDLEFVRWNVNENWTPWNCLLLTRKEAKMHYYLKDPREKYDETLSQSVHKKHMAAQGHFSAIPRFLPYLKAVYGETNISLSAESINK